MIADCFPGAAKDQKAIIKIVLVLLKLCCISYLRQKCYQN